MRHKIEKTDWLIHLSVELLQSNLWYGNRKWNHDISTLVIQNCLNNFSCLTDSISAEILRRHLEMWITFIKTSQDDKMKRYQKTLKIHIFESRMSLFVAPKFTIMSFVHFQGILGWASVIGIKTTILFTQNNRTKKITQNIKLLKIWFLYFWTKFGKVSGLKETFNLVVLAWIVKQYGKR